MSFIQSYLRKKQDSSSLAIFRLGFGILMTISIIRFWQKGWIETLYLDPSFHFSFYGFEWVKPIGEYTYLIFLVCAISAFMVAIGYKYYLSIIIFFLSFTYIELMDKTTYLNHYYFISILSFLMIFLPCNAKFSIDNILSKKECSIIIDTAKPLLERNTVVDPLEYEGSKVDNRRTSKGAHFHRSMKYSLEFDMIRRKIEYSISEFNLGLSA